jgi:hypothetical protein
MDYRCADCRTGNRKLWRPAQTFDPDILCWRCVYLRQPGEKFKGIFQDGTVPYPYDEDPRHPRTHCLAGFYVPAVPVDGEDAYWGYSSVPDMELDWWTGLPLGI